MLNTSKEKGVYKELALDHSNLNQWSREVLLLQDDGSLDSS